MVCLSAACAHRIPVFHQVEQSLAEHEYQKAYLLVKKNRQYYKKINDILFYADVGILAHYAGYFRESIEGLLEAEKKADELFTISVSRQAATFIINDYTAPYRGEDFESVIFNLILALNYLQVGQIEDALVEARKVDVKLNLINSYYPEDKKNAYKEDAFVRFLMGVLYEIGGTQEDLNDAFVSYKKAEMIYLKDYKENYNIRIPHFLIENLLTMARWIGTDEQDAYNKKYSGFDGVAHLEKRKKGEIYFIHYNGKFPEKIEHAIWLPMPDGYVMKIAFPQYRRRMYSIRDSMVKITHLDSGQTQTAKTETGEDIAEIAIKNLENRKARVTAKAIARATAKYLAIREGTRAVENKLGKTEGRYAGLLGNMAAIAMEKADLRCWKTLPAEIRIGKCQVDPGDHEVELFFFDDAGNLIRRYPLPEMTVKEGETKFLFFRTMN